MNTKLRYSLLAATIWSALLSHYNLNCSSQQRPSDDVAFEVKQTAKLLGVPLSIFPAPQGLSGMDELPAESRPFKFTIKPQKRSGAAPRVSYEERKTVTAKAADGELWEAYCGGNDDIGEIVPGHRFVSTFENRRQWYGTHLGYGYMPQNIYIGKPEAGRINPTLFFRDVGSHTTAPHGFTIDNRGMAHLAVADVNIYQNNRLDMYWVIGNPVTGKWSSAWLVDRRGFTSWSHPWAGAWSNKVHLIWDWCDVSIHKRAPGMGAYHVEWSPDGFGRKTRIFSSAVREHGAAVDQRSGLLVIVLAKDSGGVYVLSRSADGRWTRPTLLHPGLTDTLRVSIEAAGDGTFIIRTAPDGSIDVNEDDIKEWLLRPS